MSNHEQICPAALIAAPGSRQGKTAFTAALARQLSKQGKRVQVFKLGADYLDPTILEQASGQAVFNLDLWMMGESHCRALLAQAALDNEVILVESLMGLHDNQPSNAQVAKLFKLPIILVMNVAKYAQTAKAIVAGLEGYAPPTDYARADYAPMDYKKGAAIQAVIGNCVGSDQHHQLLQAALGEQYAASIRFNPAMQFAERHLGLVAAAESPKLDSQLEAAAELLNNSGINLKLAEVAFPAPKPPLIAKLLNGKTIAIAKDAAFSFIYPQNIATLKALGATIVYFSPLSNAALPKCDALWLPGGYPELHLAALSNATTTQNSLRKHQQAGKPLLAECGGMLACCATIADINAKQFNGFGLFAAHASMDNRFQSIGLQQIDYPSGRLRGHAFHHSKLHTTLIASLSARKQNGTLGAAIFKINQSTFTYLHHYFAANPAATAMLFLASR